MGTDKYYCPHCKNGIPFDDIRKAVKGQFDLEYKKISQREKQLSEEHSNWEKQFKGFIDAKDPTKYYDIIICIESILGIESGWKVKSSESGKLLYERMKNESLVKVGVIGLRNKGKSFLLQKFLNKDLPKGTSIKTEGLSIKFPNKEDLNNHRNYILLDSAGSEVPLLDYENTLKKLDKEEALSQLERIAKDKTLTELFLQRFIISSSDMIVLVVGVLTYPEQKLLNRIEKTLKNLMKQRIFKKLFVIHNLESFVEKEQVQTYIDDYLKHSATFELKENHYIETGGSAIVKKNQNNKFYVETFDNDEESPLQVFHLVMANDFSDAGKYYNEFAINYLKDHLNSFTNIKSFPVIEEIKKSFINFSDEAFENKIKDDEIDIDNNLTIKLKPDIKILFKKCFIDEMGFSNFFGSGFEPNFWIYKDKEKVNITFESSGKVKDIEPNCEYGKDGFIKFSISGNKEIKTPVEDENVKFFQNSIKQGKFNFQMKLPFGSDFKLENPDEPDFEKGSTENGTGGLYTFSYKLSNKEKKKKVYE